MKRIFFPSLVLSFLASVCFAADTAQLPKPRLEYQGRYSFDEIKLVYPIPMTSFGQAESTKVLAASIPTITPQANCQWEWRSSRELVCFLYSDQRLRKATRYHITAAALQAPTGETLASLTQEFETDRPLLESVSVDWRSTTDGELTLRFSADVELESLQHRIFLSDQLNNQRWPLQQFVPVTDVKASFRSTLPAGLRAGAAYALVINEGVRPLEGELPVVPQQRNDAVLTPGNFTFLGLSCADVNGYSREFTKLQVRPKCAPTSGVDFWFTETLTESSVEQLKASFQAKTSWSFTSSRTHPKTKQTQRLAVVRLSNLPSDTSFDQKLAGLSDIWQRVLTKQRIRFRTDEWAASLAIGKLRDSYRRDEPVALSLRSINAKELRLWLEQVTAAGIKRSEHRVTMPAFVDQTWQDWSLDLKPFINQDGALVRGYLETKGGKGRAHFGFNYSDDELLIKRSGKTLQLWVLDSKSRQPVQQADIQLHNGWDLEKTFDHAKSNAEGYTELNLPATFHGDSQVRYDHWWLRLRHANGTSIIPLNTSEWDDGEWARATEETLALAVNIDDSLLWGITDKHLYSPGETLRYQLFVRKKGRQQFSCVGQKANYHLAVFDSEQNLLLSQGPFDLDSRCTASGTIELPATLKHGLYHVIARDHAVTDEDFDDDVREQGKAFRGRFLFEISNPRPPAVNVSMQPDQAVWKTWQGPLTLTTRAAYFSGGPQLGATLTLSGSYYLPSEYSWQADPRKEQFPYFRFERFDAENQLDAIPEITDERVASEAGELRTVVQAPQWLPGVSRFNVDISSKGTDKQSYEGWADPIIVLGNDQFVGMDLRSWYPRVGQAINTQLIALDERYQPLSGKPIRLTLYRHTASRNPSYSSEVKGKRAEPLAHCDAVSAKQPVRCSITPTEPGNYELVAAIKDDQGRQHEASEWLRVYGQNAWAYEDEDELDVRLQPDKRKYRVGETAEIQLLQPFDTGKALLTVERDGVLLTRWLQLTGTETTISLPITESMRHGASIKIVLQPATEKPLKHTLASELNIDVEGFAKTMLGISTDKKAYRPGDTVSATVQLNSAGKRGLMITAVDSALLKLMFEADIYFDPDNSEFLQAYRTWRTSTEVSIGGWISRVGEERKAEFGQPIVVLSREALRPAAAASAYSDDEEEERIEVTGSRIKRTDIIGPATDDSAVLPKAVNKKAERWRARVRQQFRQNAHWLAQGETDANGKVELQFTLPDNLTAWTLIAVSYDADAEFGYGKSEFVAQLPIEARITGPEQAVMGDRIGVSAVVRNAETREKTIKAHLTISTEASADVQQTSATAKQTAYAESLLTGQFDTATLTADATTMHWLVQAQDANHEDAVAGEVQVRAPVIEKRFQTSLVVPADKQKEVRFAMPADAVGTAATMQWKPASLLTGVAETVEYMRRYPHRCWEQRTSRAWSAFLGQQLLNTNAGVAETEKFKVLDDWIKNAGAFQAPNGGFSYWRGEDRYADLGLSLYTAQAMANFRQLGWEGGRETEQRLQEFLTNSLRRWPKNEVSVRSVLFTQLLASVTKVDNHAEQLHALLRAPKQLSNEALIWLVQAVQKHQPRSGKNAVLRAELQQRGLERAGMTELANQEDVEQWRWLGSAHRTQCLAVSVLARSTKESDGISEAYRWLRAAQVKREPTGEFGNTQENAYCLQAVADLAERGIATRADGSVDVVLNQVDKTFPVEHNPLPIVLQDQNQLLLRANNGSPQWLDLTVNYRAAAKKDSNRQQGMSLQRRYEVFRNNQWQAASQNDLHVGDWVRVTLDIQNSSDLSHVALSDPLPGALVAVDAEHDATVPIHSLGALTESWSFYEKQFHEGHARFYSERLYAGTHRHQYYAKVITHGFYQALPAKVEAMYDSSRFATSDNHAFEVVVPN